MTLDSLVIATLAGVVGVIAVYFVFETWLLAWERRIPSPLVRTLYRAGADPHRLAAPGMAGEIALAERRCPSCPAIGSCREWLESGTRTGYGRFCPNAALVERLTERGAR
jgi:hypothetical protein